MIVTVPNPIPYLDISTSEDILMECYVDISLTYNYLGRTYTTIIPKSFKTNFGSIPPVAQWLIPKSGIYNDAYLLHDWMYSKLYNCPDMTKNDADILLRANLKDLGMDTYKTNLVYWAVHYFAASHFRTEA